MQWADLQRIIAEEVAAALARGRTRTCECHAVLYDCCPDRVRGVIDAGASRLGLYAGEKVPSDVASLIDHTLLKADATRQEIEKLCSEAREFGFATVCINPTWVSLARGCLRGSATGVCTVVGFPLGATTTDVKQYETRRVIFDGATEVDMVINVGALKSGDLARRRARHRRRRLGVPRLPRAEQSHHRGGAADGRGESDRRARWRRPPAPTT